MARELLLLGESSLSQEKDSKDGLRLDRLFFALRRRLFLIAGTTAFATAVAMVKTAADVPIYEAGFELSTPLVTLETQIIWHGAKVAVFG